MSGRRINPPAKMPYTRPTTDIAKEGLFNILQNMLDFEGISTLDLFGGTGAISYELASRGAAHLTVIEKDIAMHSFISENVKKLGIENCRVIRSDVFRFLDSATGPYHFIFAGPPYALGTIDELPKIIVSKKLLAPEGIFVLEHTPRNNYENFAGFFRQRNYGTTVFSFFRNADQDIANS
jgi:16S rRNA (guanine(966)-N(2))-methyltransferase RsmD